MAKVVSVTEARKRLSHFFDQATRHHEWIILTRHCKPVAAIIGAKDLQRLEQAESREIRKHVRTVEKSAERIGTAGTGRARVRVKAGKGSE
jgi:prevent-host-death family protein